MTPDHSPPARRPADGRHAGRVTRQAAGPDTWQGVDHASRVLADILAGPVAWGGIGWLADRWLGTDPWLMAIGIMVGFAGGLYMVWLRTKPDAARRAARSGRTEDRDAEG